MVDLPQPVLPSSATISPRATSRLSPSTARNGVAVPICAETTCVIAMKRISARHVSVISRAPTPRDSGTRTFSINVDDALHDQHEEHQLQRPGQRAGHVEQLLLLQQLVADAAGRADQFGHHDHARGVAEIDLPGGENVRQDRRQRSSPGTVLARVGRKRITISIRSFDMPRSASSTWNVNAGSVVSTMMKRMRELDAVKPDDGEHHPGQRRDALEQRQDRRQKAGRRRANAPSAAPARRR